MCTNIHFIIMTVYSALTHCASSSTLRLNNKYHLNRTPLSPFGICLNESRPTYYVLGMGWVQWHDVAQEKLNYRPYHIKQNTVEQQNVLPMAQQSMLGGYVKMVQKCYSLYDTSCCTLLGSSSSELMNLFTRLMETLA
jgi:hypothetical protein